MATNLNPPFNQEIPTPPEGYFLLNHHVEMPNNFIVKGNSLVSRNSKQKTQAIKLQEGDLVYDRSVESWHKITYAPATEVWGMNFYARKFIEWSEQQQQQQQQSNNSIKETYGVDCW